MTERLSDERLDELAPLLSCTRSGQVLDQDEPCSCVDCSWDAGIAESCLALLDEVRERRAAEPSRTLPCGYTMRLWKCPKCGRTFDDADELDDDSLMEDCEVPPQCGPCNETMVPA